MVVEILQCHGIPVNAKNDDIRLAAEWKLTGHAKPTGEWLVEPTNMKVKRQGVETLWRQFCVKLRIECHV